MIIDLSHTVHFVGIGGIGMSALALMLKELGYRVQGSDNGFSNNTNVDRLNKLGIQLFSGHHASHIQQATVVVKSSAISEDNPELVEARKRGLPILTRAQILASFMREKRCITVAGTNGKTTTTSLIGYLLDVAGLDPTIVSGGIMRHYNSNVRLGQSEWIVVESDESDGSFLDMPADIAVITNVESEHLDHYDGSFDKQREAFARFARQAKMLTIFCSDCPTTRQLVSSGLSYGCDAGARLRAENREENGCFEVVFDTMHFPVHFSMLGYHNVCNALAAIGAAWHAGVTDVPTLVRGLQTFPGVDRRFTLVGVWNGVSIYDDYGHHPTSIACVLAGVRQLEPHRVVVVFQPHRFTRMRDLFDDFTRCFEQADDVFVLDIYPASEAPIPGIHAQALCQAMGSKATYVPSDGDIPLLLAGRTQPGDVVIFFGASNAVSYMARQMPTLLAQC